MFSSLQTRLARIPSGFWLLQTRTFMESSLSHSWLSSLCVLAQRLVGRRTLDSAGGPERFGSLPPLSSCPSALSSLLLHQTREPCGSVH